MHRARATTFFVVTMALAGCGSGGLGGLGSGNQPTDGDASTSSSTTPTPVIDGGANSDASVVTAFGPCAGRLTKPLTAGSQVGARSGATLHWPAGWTPLPANESGGDAAVEATYTYVPTGTSNATNATARVGMSPSGVSSDAQGNELLASAATYARDNNGDAKSITVNGHPATLWWDQEPPAQPGCMNCAGDPGPDLVTIGLSIYLGATPEFGGGLAMLEVRGTARVNATPSELFCDMEAIVLGVTLAR